MTNNQVKEFIDAHCITPDFPAPGVRFIDIFPLLNEFKHSITNPFIGAVEKFILVPEARGFLFYFSLPKESTIFPLRKAGKLPGATVQIPFTKEYGEDSFDLSLSYLDYMVEHSESNTIELCFFDDILATGGTAEAVCDFFHTLRYRGKEFKVTSCRFFLEIRALSGRNPLDSKTFVQSLYQY